MMVMVMSRRMKAVQLIQGGSSINNNIAKSRSMLMLLPFFRWRRPRLSLSKGKGRLQLIAHQSDGASSSYTFHEEEEKEDGAAGLGGKQIQSNEEEEVAAPPSSPNRGYYDGSGSSKSDTNTNSNNLFGLSESLPLPWRICEEVGEGEAVVCYSSHPYHDFCCSMQDMILSQSQYQSQSQGQGQERQYEDWNTEKLEHLLWCYLSLNHPDLHSLIQTAFLHVVHNLVALPLTPPNVGI